MFRVAGPWVRVGWSSKRDQYPEALENPRFAGVAEWQTRQT